MSKAPMHSVYCINCDWELNNTHKHTDNVLNAMVLLFKRKEV